jgi:cysteine desulfurase
MVAGSRLPLGGSLRPEADDHFRVDDQVEHGCRCPRVLSAEASPKSRKNAVKTRPAYFDYNATTPTDPRVVEAMLPFFFERFGNSSSSHIYGFEAIEAVESSRSDVASLIGGQAHEVIFTSGATEANNLAIKGATLALQMAGRHVVTTAIEHKSVLESCHYLKKLGFDVTVLPVDCQGRVSVDAVRAAIRRGAAGTTERTVLVSVMGANNEIGTLQPLAEIGAVTAAESVAFHIDAAQIAGRVALDVGALNADLVSLSAHKLYGPKGVGALLFRRSDRLPHIDALIHGGGHENGLRAGTLPVPLIVGFGTACRLAAAELESEARRLAALTERLFEGLRGLFPGISMNGHPILRLPGNLHVTLPGEKQNLLPIIFQSVAASTRSACSSSMNDYSHVLRAIGLSADESARSIRFGIGRFTMENDISVALERVADAVRQRCLSGRANFDRDYRRMSQPDQARVEATQMLSSVSRGGV